jgi:hypothetical protein
VEVWLAVGMRERRKKPEYGCWEACDLKMRMGVRELLEAQQCYLITHFGSGGRDGWTAGVGLRVGSTHKVESHSDLYYCRFQECEFVIYFFCFDFRKINGRAKNFEKFTSAAIP